MIMESSLLSGPDCAKAQLILALNNDIETLNSVGSLSSTPF